MINAVQLNNVGGYLFTGLILRFAVVVAFVRKNAHKEPLWANVPIVTLLCQISVLAVELVLNFVRLMPLQLAKEG
mgnify:CR=1 FL=1